MAKRVKASQHDTLFLSGRATGLDHLSSLWKAFEQSGSISVYIAYRMQLSRLVRTPVPVKGQLTGSAE